MYMADERRACILRLLAEGGQVRSRELVREFGVTDETIRTDLEQMAQAGLLRRVRGGAVYTPPGGGEDDAVRPDCQLAALAAAHLPQGAVVYADDSPYLPALAAEAARRDWVLVTAATRRLPQLLTAAATPRLYCPGGRPDGETGLLVPEHWPADAPQPQAALLTPQGVRPDCIGYTASAAARLAELVLPLVSRVLLIVPAGAMGHDAPHSLPCTPDRLITEDAVPPELAHLPADLIPRLTPEQLRAESEFDY